MPLADRLHHGLDAGVLPHWQVGKQVVLDLVVEPDAQVVGQLAAAAVVRRAHHLRDVELLLAVVVEGEPIEVVGGVVGADHEERMGVGDRLGKQLVDEHAPHRRRAQRQKEQRNNAKVPGGVGQVADEPEPADRRAAEVDHAAHRQGEDFLVPQPLAARGIEHAHRVGGVVDDFPRAGHHRDQGILQPPRHPHAAEKLEVPLGHVRVGVLARVVVMEDVVLVVPGLGMEPVEPVDEPPPATGEHAAGIAGRNPRHAVVAAVDDVVGEQPAGELPEAENKCRRGIGDDPGSGVAHECGEPSVEFDAAKVDEVGRSDLPIDVSLQPLDGGAEARHVHGFQFVGRNRSGASVGHFCHGFH